MRSRIVLFCSFFYAGALLPACDSDPAVKAGGTGGTAGTPVVPVGGTGGAGGGLIRAAGGTPGTAAGGSAGGTAGGAAGGAAGSAAGGAAGNAAGGAAGGVAGGAAGTAGTPGGVAGAAGGAPGGSAGSSGAGDCAAARAQLIGAVDTVATGAVTITDSTAGVLTLIVDATAGGPPAAATNPWIFVDLQTGTKVAVTDVTAPASTGWDLALKRASLYTNDGQGGPGQGGAVLIAKDFDAVTAADTTGTTLATEMFVDATCAPNLDPAGSALTTFSNWYAYDETTHMLSPAPGTWLVRGGTGHLYKLQLQNYYAVAPGSGATMGASATYQLRVAAL